MVCTHCSSTILDDCLYCPRCGKPTPSAAESIVAKMKPLGFAAQEPTQSVSVREMALMSAQETPSMPSPATSRENGDAQNSVAGIAMEGRALHARLAQPNLHRIRRQWVQAIDVCVDVLKLDPGNQEAHSLLGDVYRDRGDLEDAARWYAMAIDLRPNHADEAKLRRVELERTRQNRGDRSAPQALGLGPLGEDVPGGTSYLMGISPQRWLRGITVASLAGVAIMLLTIVFLSSGRRKHDNVPRPFGNMPRAISAQNPNEALPPARLAGNAVFPEGEHSTRTGGIVGASGTGIAPDRSGTASLPQAPGTIRSENRRETSVAPAPVTAVRPASSPTSSQSKTGGFILAPPSGSHSLSGGMHMTQVQAAQGAAMIRVIAPENTNVAIQRADLIRNIYRAARTAFENDRTLTRATVVIRTGEEPRARVLMTADIDRTAATQLDADTESLPNLERQLTVR